MQKFYLRSAGSASLASSLFAFTAAAFLILPLSAAVPGAGFSTSVGPRAVSVGEATLPDSPGAMTQQQLATTSSAGAAVLAPRHKGTIKPGETAQPWGAKDKMAYAGRTITSIGGFAGDLASSGISHWDDSRPHFGTDRAGFGERLGATTYRSDVKAIFGSGILAAAFHDDPRYYVLGDTHSFQQRAIYAGTRFVIARKDDGGRGINWPQLLAPVIAQGSANGFYPSRDQAVGKTATAILTSYGTTAATNAASEFLGPIFHQLLHRF